MDGSKSDFEACNSLQLAGSTAITLPRIFQRGSSMNKYYEDGISEMLAREEIRELRYRYCRAIDARDFEAVEACFTPDVLIDYGAVGKFESRDELLNMMRGYAESNAIIGLHTALNPIIEFTSSSSATVHWVSQFSSHDPDTGTSVKQSGTYTDQCVETKSGWQIKSAIYTMLFHNTQSSGRGSAV